MGTYGEKPLMIRPFVLPATAASIATRAERGSPNDEWLPASIIDRRFEIPFREVKITARAAVWVQGCCDAANQGETCGEGDVVVWELHFVF